MLSQTFLGLFSYLYMYKYITYCILHVHVSSSFDIIMYVYEIVSNLLYLVSVFILTQFACDLHVLIELLLNRSPRCSTPSELPSSPEPTQPDQMPMDVTWDHFEAMDDRNQHPHPPQPHPRRRSGSTRVNTTLSPGSFSSIPTGPRDWMVVDALPEKLNTWHSSALYVIGEKEVLIDVPEESNCMFIPVEVRTCNVMYVSITQWKPFTVGWVSIARYMCGVKNYYNIALTPNSKLSEHIMYMYTCMYICMHCVSIA